jgi:hypothetical protein
MSLCLYLLNTGITGMYHHIWLLNTDLWSIIWELIGLGFSIDWFPQWPCVPISMRQLARRFCLLLSAFKSSFHPSWRRVTLQRNFFVFVFVLSF